MCFGRAGSGFAFFRFLRFSYFVSVFWVFQASSSSIGRRDTSGSGWALHKVFSFLFRSSLIRRAGGHGGWFAGSISFRQSFPPHLFLLPVLGLFLQISSLNAYTQSQVQHICLGSLGFVGWLYLGVIYLPDFACPFGVWHVRGK
ncbi:hypothetical protein CCUS01_09633 [Colletotrichum cuscutae]|uniref:Uncharacterized protein n=1 Tax=Colletotrichum cuscutae TaxID=1209917 RepID=A0AAI9UJ53_9PEZI|nr:hypothetical protein CCUS01_09633 [Colletotrichum cuscutae]